MKQFFKLSSLGSLIYQTIVLTYCFSYYLPMSKAKGTGFSSIDTEDENLRERYVNQSKANASDIQDEQLDCFEQLEEKHRTKKNEE